MCADQIIHNLEENGQKNIVLVFCGEQPAKTLKEETLQEIMNHAVLVPVNLKNGFSGINDNRDTVSLHNSISPAMIKITEILCDLGIPTNLLGYEYLRFAISIALTDRQCLYGITKILYPTVAKEFKTSSSRVERAIRHAIEVASIRGDIDVFRKFFGNTINPDTGKPTNSEFISKIVDRLKMDDSILSTILNHV